MIWLKTVGMVLVVYLLAMTGPMHAEEAKVRAMFDSWAVFAVGDPRPTTCWAAHSLHYDPDVDQEYLLAVTQFGGLANPQVSIFSNKRMVRSVGLFLNIEGRHYRMRSDGTNAWVSKTQENWVIKKLLEAAENRDPNAQPVRAGSKGFAAVDVDMKGFDDALARALELCGRR